MKFYIFKATISRRRKRFESKKNCWIRLAIRVPNPAEGDPRFEDSREREKVKACFAPRKYY